MIMIKVKWCLACIRNANINRNDGDTHTRHIQQADKNHSNINNKK